MLCYKNGGQKRKKERLEEIRLEERPENHNEWSEVCWGLERERREREREEKER